VSLSWHAPEGVEVMVALNSRTRYHDDVRYHAITRNLAEILAFAHYFHDTFVMPAIGAHQAREIELPPLSRRETQCLSLAAQGMTTKRISAALHVSARTVQAEFERICGKYGAANRREAIALAVRTGAVRAPAKGIGGRGVA
jgi:DNA-binding CsgD family transcriptional regulator